MNKILSTLLAVSCVCHAADTAPKSVAGKTIIVDTHGSETRNRYLGSTQWCQWQTNEYPCKVSFSFDKKNEEKYEYALPESVVRVYVKTGPNSAEIRFKASTNKGKYILNFETLTSGTAIETGCGEGSEYQVRNIKFSIK